MATDERNHRLRNTLQTKRKKASNLTVGKKTKIREQNSKRKNQNKKE